MNGHKLRILSSENDASVKVQQDQNTNITLKLEHAPSQADLKETAPQINGSPPFAPPGFTPGAPMPTPLAPHQYQQFQQSIIYRQAQTLPPLIIHRLLVQYKLVTLISRLTLRTKTDRLKYLRLYFRVMRTIHSSSTSS